MSIFLFNNYSWLQKQSWLHSGVMVNTVTLQQEDPGSWGWPKVRFCGVCILFPPGTPVSKDMWIRSCGHSKSPTGVSVSGCSSMCPLGISNTHLKLYHTWYFFPRNDINDYMNITIHVLFNSLSHISLWAVQTRSKKVKPNPDYYQIQLFF